MLSFLLDSQDDEGVFIVAVGRVDDDDDDDDMTDRRAMVASCHVGECCNPKASRDKEPCSFMFTVCGAKRRFSLTSTQASFGSIKGVGPVKDDK